MGPGQPKQKGVRSVPRRSAAAIRSWRFRSVVAPHDSKSKRNSRKHVHNTRVHRAVLAELAVEAQGCFEALPG